jgi:hypothetical protein
MGEKTYAVTDVLDGGGNAGDVLEETLEFATGGARSRGGNAATTGIVLGILDRTTELAEGGIAERLEGLRGVRTRYHQGKEGCGTYRGIGGRYATIRSIDERASCGLGGNGIWALKKIIIINQAALQWRGCSEEQVLTGTQPGECFMRAHLLQTYPVPKQI